MSKDYDQYQLIEIMDLQINYNLIFRIILVSCEI
jgi:hypothetical protein